MTKASPTPAPALSEPRPLVAVTWMVVTGLLFVGVTALVKVLGPRIPASEAAFLRYAMGLVFFIPMIGQMLRERMARSTLVMFGARGVFHTFGVALWFYAMARIPIADVTAIGYLSPVYVTIGAAIFLGERLAARRIVAVAVALVGVVIVLRPGAAPISSGHLAMLAAAFVFAGSYLLAKQLTNVSTPLVVVAMLSITVTIGLAPMAAAVWVTPTAQELGILFGIACVATAGHYTMTLGLAAAPINITQPVTFLQLVWAVALGAAFFNEPIDFWVVLGGGIIFASVTFISLREAVLKRQSTPTVGATKV